MPKCADEVGPPHRFHFEARPRRLADETWVLVLCSLKSFAFFGLDALPTVERWRSV